MAEVCHLLSTSLPAVMAMRIPEILMWHNQAAIIANGDDA
jgi:hypothetical protein